MSSRPLSVIYRPLVYTTVKAPHTAASTMGIHDRACCRSCTVRRLISERRKESARIEPRKGLKVLERGATVTVT